MSVQSLIAQIRDAQSRSKTTDSETSMGYVLVTEAILSINHLNDLISRVLELAFELEPLFPKEYEEEDSSLGPVYFMRIANISFDQIESSPFEITYYLLDNVAELVSVEPNLEVSFFNGDTSTFSGSCFVDESQEPQDRGWALRMIRAEEAWNYSISLYRPAKGDGVLIAQPDTGVAKHDELTNSLRMDLGENFVEKNLVEPVDPLTKKSPFEQPGHGTATASVIASRGTLQTFVPPGPSGTGGPGFVTGSAPSAKVIPIRAIRSVIRVSQASVAQAINHARSTDAKIISMSLGGLPSIALWRVINKANEENKIVMAAAGNCVGTVVFPARYDNCIAVAGVNIHHKPWKGSCSGSTVDFSAPAEFVWRAKRVQPSDPLDIVSGGQGTSFAVALSAGVAALWIAHFGYQKLIDDLNQGESLLDRFRNSVMSTANVPPGWNGNDFGAGIIDAEKLLRGGHASLPQEDVTEELSKKDADIIADAAKQILGEVIVFDEEINSCNINDIFKNIDFDRFGLEIIWLVMRLRQNWVYPYERSEHDLFIERSNVSDDLSLHLQDIDIDIIRYLFWR